MKNNLFVIIIFFIVFVSIATPVTVLADHLPWHPLVPCGITDPAADECLKNECTFWHLIELVRRIISFLILIAIPLAAVAFAIAGFMYLTSAGDTGKVSRAHTIFVNTFFGIIIALIAWLLVNAIATTLLKDDFLRGSFWFLGSGSSTSPRLCPSSSIASSPTLTQVKSSGLMTTSAQASLAADLK